MQCKSCVKYLWHCTFGLEHIKGFVPKGPYLPCVSLAGRAFLAGYHRYTCTCISKLLLNTLRPRQDGRHFVYNIFKCIFFNENCCILIKILLKYVRKGPIDNNPALAQILGWCQTGDKPLSEPIMSSFGNAYICVSQPHWFKEPR